MIINRMNPYQHIAPPGWSEIVKAPRDGTVIEIQNNWGIAPSFALFRWVEGRGWQRPDDSGGVMDGPHLSWRAYEGDASAYVDPTGGAQDSPEYWVRHARSLGYDVTDAKPTSQFATPRSGVLQKVLQALTLMNR